MPFLDNLFRPKPNQPEEIAEGGEGASEVSDGRVPGVAGESSVILAPSTQLPFLSSTPSLSFSSETGSSDSASPILPEREEPSARSGAHADHRNAGQRGLAEPISR